jgi:hypothetical protein
LIVVGIALFAGITVWFLTGCNRDGADGPIGAGSGEGARIVPVAEMNAVPDEMGHAVFWAGDQPDSEIELSNDPSGNVHVRYLTDGAEAGASEQTFLDIGTYPFEDAYETTKNLAGQAKLTKVEVGEDGIGFYDPKNPYSVILAFPDEPDLQIEVYHPEKNAALGIVNSGDIVPLP